MTKKISALLAFITLLFAGFALAQGAAVVTSATGVAQVQTGPGTPRALRVGDRVQQGDTVSTGAASSLVLKFDDGEAAALTQNSRMTITAYQYEPASQSGNMLLSLVTGGMRAITGFLGRSHPDRVAYRAATTTIGIRGTDVSMATDGNDVMVTVSDGTITLTVGTNTVTLTAGKTAYIHNGAISSAPPAGFNSAVVNTAALVALPLVGGSGAATISSGTAGQVSITNGGAGGGNTVSNH
jgi:hypothetical protein